MTPCLELVTGLVLLPVLLKVTRYRDLEPRVWTVRQNRGRP